MAEQGGRSEGMQVRRADVRTIWQHMGRRNASAEPSPQLATWLSVLPSRRPYPCPSHSPGRSWSTRTGSAPRWYIFQNVVERCAAPGLPGLVPRAAGISLPPLPGLALRPGLPALAAAGRCACFRPPGLPSHLRR